MMNNNCNQGSNVASATVTSNTVHNSASADPPKCFICDAKVQGRHYNLATCKTQNTRSRVIEKLGELVGEKYMVVICEDDVICRSCANLMNTLDRLETEMKGVREAILLFLEKKYSLDEGELVRNNSTIKLSQPPQIARNQTDNNGCNGKERELIVPFDSYTPPTKAKKTTNVWLQCDKCQYTTKLHTFMVNHLRDHILQNIHCDKCGVQFPGTQHVPMHPCNSQSDPKNRSRGTDKSTSQELNDLAHNSKSDQALPMMAVESNTTILRNVTDTTEVQNPGGVQLLSLTNTDDLQIQGLLNNDGTTNIQPLYLRVIQSDSLQSHLGEQMQTTQSGSSQDEILLKIKDSGDKQVLTLTGEGNLEMVEVAWNDVQNTHPDMTF